MASPWYQQPVRLPSPRRAPFSATGEQLHRDGNRGPAAAPQNLYRTADPPNRYGEHHWVAVAVESDAQWRGLVEALGRPDWTLAPDLAASEGRRRAHDAIDSALGAWCLALTSDCVVALLSDAGVPVAPVLTTGELVDLAPHSTRPFLESVDHPVTGRSLHTTYPIRFEHGPERWHQRAAPTVGRDNGSVLRDLLGLTEEHIDQLERAGVIGSGFA